MSEADQRVCDLFTKSSHLRKTSVMFVTQNPFHKNKHARTTSLNCHYMVVFKILCDANQLAALARQMYPDMSKFLGKAFRDAAEKPYGYLFIDLNPDTDNKCRVKTNVFPTTIDSMRTL